MCLARFPGQVWLYALTFAHAFIMKSLCLLLPKMAEEHSLGWWAAWATRNGIRWWAEVPRGASFKVRLRHFGEQLLCEKAAMSGNDVKAEETRGSVQILDLYTVYLFHFISFYVYLQCCCCSPEINEAHLLQHILPIQARNLYNFDLWTHGATLWPARFLSLDVST